MFLLESNNETIKQEGKVSLTPKNNLLEGHFEKKRRSAWKGLQRKTVTENLIFPNLN